jgi:hypothetical protein
MKRNFSQIFYLFSLGLALFICVNMGEGKRQKNHTPDRPEIFKLKKGRPSFKGVIVDSDAKEKNLLVRNIRIYDPTQSSRIRSFREGETFLQALSEDEDSDTKIDLKNISSIRVIDKAFLSKKYPGRMFVKIGVMPKKGTRPEYYLLTRDIELCATVNSTSFEKSWYLHSINGIKDVAISTSVNENEKPTWYPPTHKGKDLEKPSMYKKVKRFLKLEN